VNSVTGLTAGFTDSLALKLSYTVLYSNEPLTTTIAPDGGAVGQNATYAFDSTDTILAVALVVNF